jgi:predicted transcriptional regulator
MTELLEKAIARVRGLSEEEQNALALTIIAMADEHAFAAPLDDETRAAILEGLEQARRGELVPEEEIEALWKRYAR